MVNAVILLIVIGILGYESIMRFSNPKPIQGTTIAWIAGLGILINGISTYLFYKNKKELNARSAYLHLLADTLVSLGVVVGGIVISFTSWYWVDPAIGLTIMVIIIFGTWALLKNSFKMAIDAVPSGIDINQIRNVIIAVDNVIDAYHIHVWALSTTENALTAHVEINNKLNFEEKMNVIKAIKHKLEHYNIHHSTIELDTNKKTDAETLAYQPASNLPKDSDIKS